MKNKTKINIVDTIHDLSFPLFLMIYGFIIMYPYVREQGNSAALGGFIFGIGLTLFGDTNRWWKK